MDLHPSLEELTKAVHGLGPTPDHLALCSDCLATVERLREERALLSGAPRAPASRTAESPTPVQTFIGWMFGPRK